MNRLVRAELRRLFSTPLWRWGPPARGPVRRCAHRHWPCSSAPRTSTRRCQGIDTEARVRLALSLIGLTVARPRAVRGARCDLGVPAPHHHLHVLVRAPAAPGPRGETRRVRPAGTGYRLIVALSAAIALVRCPRRFRGIRVGAHRRDVGGDARVPRCGDDRLHRDRCRRRGTAAGPDRGARRARRLPVHGGAPARRSSPASALVYPFLPGGATAALTQASLMGEASTRRSPARPRPLLPPALGAVVLLAYALLAAAAPCSCPCGATSLDIET